jgi:hypothetical protein
MNPYDAVLTDLRAKRDAMSELIAALENVQKLGAPALAFVEAPTAERAVSQSVSQSVSQYKNRAAREGETDTEGDRRANARRGTAGAARRDGAQGGRQRRPARSPACLRHRARSGTEGHCLVAAARRAAHAKGHRSGLALLSGGRIREGGALTMALPVLGPMGRARTGSGSRGAVARIALWRIVA